MLVPRSHQNDRPTLLLSCAVFLLFSAFASCRPDLGILPARGQNPAEFILLAAKAAIMASATGDDSDERLRDERVRSFYSQGAAAAAAAAGGYGARYVPPSSPGGGLSLSYSCSSFASSSSLASSRIDNLPLLGVDPSSAAVRGNDNGSDSVVGDGLLPGDAEEGLLLRPEEPPPAPPPAPAPSSSSPPDGLLFDGSDDSNSSEYLRRRIGDSSRQELLRRRAWGAGGGRESAVYAVGFWEQAATLWRRGWTVQKRRKDAVRALFAKNLLVGLLTATVFWREGAMSRGEGGDRRGGGVYDSHPSEMAQSCP